MMHGQKNIKKGDVVIHFCTCW